MPQSLLDRLLSYGTEHLDRLAFQKALDDIGASGSAGSDFSVKVLAQNFDRGVELLSITNFIPRYPKRR